MLLMRLRIVQQKPASGWLYKNISYKTMFRDERSLSVVFGGGIFYQKLVV